MHFLLPGLVVLSIIFGISCAEFTQAEIDAIQCFDKERRGDRQSQKGEGFKPPDPDAFLWRLNRLRRTKYCCLPESQKRAGIEVANFGFNFGGWMFYCKKCASNPLPSMNFPSSSTNWLEIDDAREPLCKAGKGSFHCCSGDHYHQGNVGRGEGFAASDCYDATVEVKDRKQEPKSRSKTEHSQEKASTGSQRESTGRKSRIMKPVYPAAPGSNGSGSSSGFPLQNLLPEGVKSQ